MKKIAAVALLVCLVFSCAIAETATDVDITYKYLYMNILSALKTEEENGNDNRLNVTCATVWKKNDEKAGFSFEGDDWMIYGEANMDTGVITHIMCKLPYDESGLIATYIVAFTLSGMTSTDEFFSKYAGENTILKNEAFPNYVNTLDAGNETTMVYEFTRIGSESLNNEANKCYMAELIKSLQQ